MRKSEFLRSFVDVLELAHDISDEQFLSWFEHVIKEELSEKEQLYLIDFLNGAVAVEISEKYGVGRSTVSRSLHRATKKLRQAVKLRLFYGHKFS